MMREIHCSTRTLEANLRAANRPGYPITFAESAHQCPSKWVSRNNFRHQIALTCNNAKVNELDPSQR